MYKKKLSTAVDLERWREYHEPQIMCCSGQQSGNLLCVVASEKRNRWLQYPSDSSL